jgi:hypothetical protein
MVKTGKTVRDVARHRGVKIAWNLSTTKHYHERNEKAAARRVRPPYLSRLKGTL